MYARGEDAPVVRREWLPAYTIVWLTFSSLLVLARLILRATGRSSNLGLDDVRGKQSPRSALL